MHSFILLILAIGIGPAIVRAQPNGPWNSPLLMAWSQDGRVFSTPTTFQDSSGVPSVIRWKGDTLVAAFQWFREPRTAPTWDRVAVKFSYDAGLTWTEPEPIVIDAFPTNYQRPFDPTLAVVDGRIRIYFSSSDGMPVGGLNEIVNTYSAISDDGIQYTFEPGARFDHAVRPVIDPAVIYFRNEWHYAAPAGAPQDGAFHAASVDGLEFEPRAPYPSDQQHNWTGNYCLANDTTVRFYGSGPRLWYAESNDAQSWRPYVDIGMVGGDPSALKIDEQRWLIVYVGPRYITTVDEETSDVRCPASVKTWVVDVLGRVVEEPGIGTYFRIELNDQGQITARRVLSGFRLFDR